MPAIPGYPLSELFDPDGSGPHPAALSNLVDADVVIGRDTTTKREFVVFRRDTLQRVADGEDAAHGYNILCIEVDVEGSDDLDRLLALVAQAKGRHEFAHFRRAER